MKKEKKEIISKKEAIFWLHRVLAQKSYDLEKIAKRIGDLNHQIANFNKMNEYVQEEVIKELEVDFQHYKWNMTFEAQQ